MGGTVGNAHLAAGADIQKTFQGTGSGRKNALGRVQLPGGISPASGKGGRSQPDRSSLQELAAGTPGNGGNRGGRRGSGSRGNLLFLGRNLLADPGKPAVAYSSLTAGAHAIVARHAT